jgi:NADH-quinone oxidoreductase subunit G
VKPSEIAIIGSGRMTNEELYLSACLIRVLGVEKFAVIPRVGGADNYLRADDLNPNSNGVRKIWGIEPGENLEAVFENITRARARVVITFGENLRKAGLEARHLQKIEFLASTHVLANATAEHSHVVLPAATYAEKRGSMINATGRLQKLNKAIESPGEARDDWEFLRDLILAVSGTNGLYSVDDVFKQMAGEIEIFKGLTLSRIGDLGLPLLETTEKVPLLEREHERKAKGIIVG